ncbi:hypothetical protein INT46_003314 [Mucor plumbeus]|uniref:Transposase Tc1-like domain-containing protein n=1 Tax=Mucor plumbeus TaxID=97098 RepID=A0A8H7R540_9FUNG|nr:hypothetical protein INT46_003314 [Mucor plumbeus]
MAPSLSGRHTLISATSGITFPKKAVLGKLKTRKDVEIYPNGLETEKKPLLTATHRSKRLSWANAHKSWTKNNLRHMISSDKTKISIWGSDGINPSNRPGKNN